MRHSERENLYDHQRLTIHRWRRDESSGPAGSLPLTEEMLRERPSGDLFGWTQNAGMGWEPAARRPRVPDALHARRHPRA